MTTTATTATNDPGTEASYDLGVIRLRLLVDSVETAGAYALGEFSGEEGPWTVPHIHSGHDESFYVLEGTFTFTVGDEEVLARPRTFVRIGRDQRHLIHASAGGGRLLALWVPGGLEQMFVELSRLPADSLRDPETRRSLSARFDSTPV
jgi:quercetin dioxygenase-like cupin family protein